MKFHRALFLLFFICVDAKKQVSGHGVKVTSKAGKIQHHVGPGSLLDDKIPQAGRSQLSKPESSVNHGNIANGLSKYGHFGLKAEGNPSGDRHNNAGEHKIGAFFPIRNAESLERGIDEGSKIKYASSNEGENKSQCNQRKVQFGVNSIPQQYPYVGPSPIYYRSAPYGAPGPYGAPLRVINQGSVNQGPLGTLFAQGRAQDQPAAYPGLGTGVGQGRGQQFDASPIRLQGTAFTFSQPANYYGAYLRQGGRLVTQFGHSDVQGQYTNGGQPASYESVPGTNILAQNEQLGPSLRSGEQGVYTDLPAAPGSNIQGHGGSLQGFLLWLKSVSPATLGLSGGPLSNPIQPQVGQYPCPVRYTSLPGDGRRLPYCTNGQTVAYVSAPSSYQPHVLTTPGIYGGVENAVASKAFGARQSAAVNGLSRYINTGFYYPPFY